MVLQISFTFDKMPHFTRDEAIVINVHNLKMTIIDQNWIMLTSALGSL